MAGRGASQKGGLRRERRGRNVMNTAFKVRNAENFDT